MQTDKCKACALPLCQTPCRSWSDRNRQLVAEICVIYKVDSSTALPYTYSSLPFPHLLRLLNKLMHNFDRPRELRLVLRGGLHRARTAAAPSRAAVHPLKFLGAIRDARVQLVDIFAAGWRLRRDGRQDRVQLVEQRRRACLGDCERLGQRVLQCRRARRAHCGGDSEIGVGGRAGHGVDRAGCRWGEPAGDACAGRSVSSSFRTGRVRGSRLGWVPHLSGGAVRTQRVPSCGYAAGSGFKDVV